MEESNVGYGTIQDSVPSAALVRSGGVEGMDVPNLRDVASASPARIHSKMLYRSSCVFSDEDLRRLQVRTVIDLRRDKTPFVVETRQGLRLEKVPFVGKKAGMNLLSSFPLCVKVYLVLTCCLTIESTVIDQVMESNESMIRFYMTILLHSDEEIRRNFAILANPDNYPVFIHCVAGKDRTGLVVALVLALCGVDLEAIDQDYALSQANLDAARAKGQLSEHEKLLTPFAAISPPGVMKGTLEEIISRFGSIEAYLTAHIKVPASHVAAVRRIMSM